MATKAIIFLPPENEMLISPLRPSTDLICKANNSLHKNKGNAILALMYDHKKELSLKFPSKGVMFMDPLSVGIIKGLSNPGVISVMQRNHSPLQ